MADPGSLPDIPEFGKVEPNKKVEQESQNKPNTKAFESLMNEKPEATQTGQVSPMQLASIQTAGLTPSFNSLIGQTLSSQTQINDIKNKLQTPNLTLKNSHQKLLDSKLSEASEHLQKASQYIGANEISPTEISEEDGPVAKFLGYLTDGQNRLLEVQKQVRNIASTKGELPPSQMLLVQINLAQAQQEIEFSSVLLSKVTDALKQTFSIQL